MAFPPYILAAAKIGILSGSIASGAAGLLTLRWLTAEGASRFELTPGCEGVLTLISLPRAVSISVCDMPIRRVTCAFSRTTEEIRRLVGATWSCRLVLVAP